MRGAGEVGGGREVRGARERFLHWRLAPTLCAVAAALVGLLALIPRPATGVVVPTADYVVIAGAPGLRWDDVNPTDTPVLWRLAERGSIGALSVRSASRITCPTDGWLTLGAGNYALYRRAPTTEVCPPLAVDVVPADRGASLPGYSEVVAANVDLPWDAQPGALAEAVRCTAAIGPGAAVAAAHPYGRVDRYAPTLDAESVRLVESCSLSTVDIGTVVGEGEARRTATRQVDAALGVLLASRPPRSVVMVAGLADTGPAGRLHVAIAEGPGYAGGWLTSPTTVRPGYVQLVDLAPTALAALDRPIPPKVFAGGAATRTAGRPVSLADAVGRLADADREASVQRQVGGNFFAVLSAAELLLFLALVPVLRRIRRPAGPVASAPVPRWLFRTAEVLLMGTALAVPAALVADLVPWWRWSFPGLVFGLVTVVVLAAGTAAVVLGTAGRRALAPLGWVAAAAAGAVALDVLTGARLQLNGVAGYSAVGGGRYAGLGVIGLGVLVAGVLLAAGSLAQRVRREWRPFVVALVGAVGVVVVGSAYLGADAGGAVALSAGVCVAAAMSTGGWLTFARLAWAVVAAFGVTVAFALIDLSRPVEQRTSVGRFLDHLRDGTAGTVTQRLVEANVVQTATSPLTVLALGFLLFSVLVLLRPWGGLRRLFGLYPAVRAAVAGIAVATVLAGLGEGAGSNVLGAALALAAPLVALAALRVLEHADDRTQAPGWAPPAEPKAPDLVARAEIARESGRKA
jgi:hypothetical protein